MCDCLGNDTISICLAFKDLNNKKGVIMRYLKQSWKTNLNADKNHYKIDWFNLSLRHYNKAKINDGLINCMQEQGFNKYSAIYDIAMDLFTELGYADINHEQIIKHIESLYGRDLYHYELVDYVQAINDYQN